MDSSRLESLKEKLTGWTAQVNRYRLLIFVAFVVIIYGFILFRINTLNNAQPSQDQIAAQNNPIKAARVDKSVVNHLQSLQDNSVNVQTLFTQARTNPFQE